MIRFRNLATMICLLATSLPLGAMDLEGNLSLEEDGKAASDIEMLRFSHFSRCVLWNAVKGKKGSDPNAEETFGWQYDKRSGGIRPLAGGKEAYIVLDVPQDGSYRLWLRQHMTPGKARPVTLTLSGATTAKLTYGKTAIQSGEPGKVLEKKGALRFEDDLARSRGTRKATWVWEYRDLDLRKGATRAALTSRDHAATVGVLFLTRCKSFPPNMDSRSKRNTLKRVFYRLRLTAAKKAKHWQFRGAKVYYHKTQKRGGWSSYLTARSRKKKDRGSVTGTDGKPLIRIGEWSSWIDASYSASGRGPWGTVKMGIMGVQDGQLEIQMAWYPHEAGVVKTIRPVLDDGRAVFIIPLCARVVHRPRPNPQAPDRPIWGMIGPVDLDRFESVMDVHKRHLAWSLEARRELGLTDDHPMPKKLWLSTGYNGTPSGRKTAAEMLASLGITRLRDVDESICREAGIQPTARLSFPSWGDLAKTHDPCDPAVSANVIESLRAIRSRREQSNPKFAGSIDLVKLGDEISAIASVYKINLSADCSAHFQAYLAKLPEVKDQGPAFFGVADLADLQSLPLLPARAGRFERRLYYHSMIHRQILSADYYRHTTEAAAQIFPNSTTYANFSPHPITLGSQTMNDAEWFSLPRLGGASRAWGEDWTGGSWSYNGIEVVSYYGGWVECAARWGKQPSGFYNICSRGLVDHKLFSLISRRIDHILFYAYGPMYGGGEGSNYWSEDPLIYKQILRGTAALGPADTIIADGTLLPRKVGLLYNRAHEIMSGGKWGLQCDRAITFAALGFVHADANIILNEDLTDELLAAYKVLYINGFNLPAAAVPVLERWVKAGGTLVANAGTGRFNRYNDPLPAFARLAGADQTYRARSTGKWHPLKLHQHEPIDMLTVSKSDLTPSIKVPLIGTQVVLTPHKGVKTVATYEDGSCAGTLRTLGKGRVLLLGFQPGVLYKGAQRGLSRYMDERIDLVVRPALAALGTLPTDCDAKQVEMARFEHADGIAITLNNFRYWEEHDKQPTLTLTVRTDRKITSARSGLRGKLELQMADGVATVKMPLPAHVDTVILRE